jgi:hypothetical protein
VNNTWRDRMPRGVLDPYGPHGEPIFTPTDRRMLWHLEGALTVAATNDTLRQLATDLRAYLNETCQHHWTDYDPETGIPAHRQCLWCCGVEWSVAGPDQGESP